MKPITVTFNAHEENGKMYVYIPSDKWQVLTNDDKSIILGESYISKLGGLTPFGRSILETPLTGGSL
jgi:hypothetical protein